MLVGGCGSSSTYSMHAEVRSVCIARAGGCYARTRAVGCRVLA